MSLHPELLPPGVDAQQFLELVHRAVSEEDSSFKSVRLRVAPASSEATAPRQTREVQATELAVRAPSANAGDEGEVVKQVTVPFLGGKAILRLRAPSHIARATETARDAGDAMRRVAAFGAAAAVWEKARRLRTPQRAGQDLIYSISRDAVPGAVGEARFLEALQRAAVEDRSFWSGAGRPRSVAFRFAPPAAAGPTGVGA